MSEVYQLPPSPPEKRCGKCGATKPLGDFYRARRMKDGHQLWCKDCKTLHYQSQKAEDPTKVRAYAERNRYKNRERQPAYPLVAECRRCKATLPAHRFCRDTSRREGLDAYCRDCRSVINRAGVGERVAVVQQRNRRNHALRRMGVGRFTVADIAGLEDRQAGLCAYCELPYGKHHIDHKQPLSRGGTNWPDNLCLTCAQCNFSKRNKTEAEFRAWLALHPYPA